MNEDKQHGLSSTAVIWAIAGLVILIAAIIIFKSNSTTSNSSPRPEDSASLTRPAPSPSPSATESTKSESVIINSETGFTPASLTVKNGTEVIFKNQSSGAFWPASAPHPTHTIYPEFDARKPIAPGESYSFTFTKSGTWKYHDHLRPNHYGEIIVQ